MREIEYEPRNLREILVELRDASELAVDLAYSALLFKNRELAGEVIDLERRVDYLRYHARIALMLAAKRADEAERLVGIFQVVESAVAVTSAAGDIARILLEDVGLPAEFESGFPEAQEDLLRAEVAPDSTLAGRTLADSSLDVETGVWLIAIRRNHDWDIHPEGGDELRAGDVIVGRGPRAGVREAYELATGEPYPEADRGESDVEGLDRAVETVIELKNVSELAVGLAYGAALSDSDAIAAEVQSLEEESDAMRDRLETWLLEASRRVDDPGRLRGLFHLGVASEAITDAALDVAEVVMRDVKLHPVFAQAVLESDEIVTSVTVAPDSDLAGRTIEEFELAERTGMVALAVHGDGRWRYDPAGDTALDAGDVLVVKGPQRGRGRLRRLAGQSAR